MLITTERLTLRPFAESDFDDFSAYASDAEVWRSLAFEALDGPEAVRKQFDKMLRQDVYAVVYGERVVGQVAVEPLRPSLADDGRLRGKKGVSLSCAIARPYQRRGLMLEAMSGVIRHLFDDRGLDFVNAGYGTFNEPSKKLQEKLGFTPIATHPYRRGGKEHLIVEGVLFRE